MKQLKVYFYTHMKWLILKKNKWLNKIIHRPIHTGVSTMQEMSVTPGTVIFPGVLHEGAKAFLILLLGCAFSFPMGSNTLRFAVK